MTYMAALSGFDDPVRKTPVFAKLLPSNQ